MFWIWNDVLWFCSRLYLVDKIINEAIPFTIGITTFMDRFDNSFKPLLKRISSLFPDCQVIVVANGHVKKAEQMIYLNDIQAYCKYFSQIKLISYEDPKGLSFIWNMIMQAAKNDPVMILNDDLKIKTTFRKFVHNSGLLNKDIALINNSWSHFIITKNIFNEIGHFDEGLLEIGGEDDDYAARLALKNYKISNMKTYTIASKLKIQEKMLKVNSYGKNMRYEKNGYSNYNSEYLNKKWETSMQYFEGSVEVPNRIPRYWKLR